MQPNFNLYNAGLQHSVAQSLQQIRHARRLLAALERKDLNVLRTLAQKPGGFLTDHLRRKIWPLLCHTDYGCYVNEKGSDVWMGAQFISLQLLGRVEKDLADSAQIAKDIDRSFYYYPRGISPAEKAQKQRELHSMVVEILWRNPRLKYYQGFHDVCSCFLLVFGKKDAIPAAENIALFFLSTDGMLDSFDPISKQLRLMSSIVQYEDQELSAYLERCNVMPYYALSWILTWYSHDLQDFGKIARLVDLFIASSPLMPMYIASAITLSRRHEILRADPDNLHSLVTHIPQDIDIEPIIEKALELQRRYQPLALQKRTGLWLHEEAAANTWEKDWHRLEWNQVPDRLSVESYLSHPISKEVWEDEMLAEWMTRRLDHQ